MSLNSASFEENNYHPEKRDGETHVAEDLNELLQKFTFSHGVSLEADVHDAAICVEETKENVWTCFMAPIFTARPPYTMIEGIIDKMHWSVRDANGCLVAEGMVGDEQTFTFSMKEEGYPFMLSFSFHESDFTS